MKILSSRIHGILDYLMGIVLIASPFIFDFNYGGAETYIPIILGIGVILYSLITNYEYSISKVISMETHLWLDGLGGAFLAASPWIFGFSDLVFLPHLILGLAEITAALTTERTPSYTPTHTRALN